MNKIGFKNFKAYGDTIQTFSNKPITLVYGANSIGKSSFLHAMLYAHHILKNKNDIDLYNVSNGDELDFGGFANFIHKHETERKIEFIFEQENTTSLELTVKNASDENLLSNLFTLDQHCNVIFLLTTNISELSKNISLKRKEENLQNEPNYNFIFNAVMAIFLIFLYKKYFNKYNPNVLNHFDKILKNYLNFKKKIDKAENKKAILRKEHIVNIIMYSIEKKYSNLVHDYSKGYLLKEMEDILSEDVRSEIFNNMLNFKGVEGKYSYNIIQFPILNKKFIQNIDQISKSNDYLEGLKKVKDIQKSIKNKDMEVLDKIKRGNLNITEKVAYVDSLIKNIKVNVNICKEENNYKIYFKIFFNDELYADMEYDNNIIDFIIMNNERGGYKIKFNEKGSILNSLKKEFKIDEIENEISLSDNKKNINYIFETLMNKKDFKSSMTLGYIAINKLNKIIMSNIRRFHYFSPLRFYPKRDDMIHKISNIGLSRSIDYYSSQNCWKILAREDIAQNVINKLNNWLGDSKKLSSNYKIEVKKFFSEDKTEEIREVCFKI